MLFGNISQAEARALRDRLFVEPKVDCSGLATVEHMGLEFAARQLSNHVLLWLPDVDDISQLLYRVIIGGRYDLHEVVRKLEELAAADSEEG